MINMRIIKFKLIGLHACMSINNKAKLIIMHSCMAQAHALAIMNCFHYNSFEFISRSTYRSVQKNYRCHTLIYLPIIQLL